MTKATRSPIPTTRNVGKVAGYQQEVAADDEQLQNAHEQLAVLAYVGDLVAKVIVCLKHLYEIRPQEMNPVAGNAEWVDGPLALLRPYLLEMVDRLIAALRQGMAEDNTLSAAQKEARIASVLSARNDIDRKPAPSHQIVDVCTQLAAFLQLYVFVQTGATCQERSELPSESTEDLVDEKARATIEGADRDQTLAGYRLAAREMLHYDKRQLDKERQSVRRRRKVLDDLIEPHVGRVRQERLEELNILVASGELDPEGVRRVRETIRHLEDPTHPLARELTKSWLKMLVTLPDLTFHLKS